eukprot:3356010-Rhodomonas_salina.2
MEAASLGFGHVHSGGASRDGWGLGLGKMPRDLAMHAVRLCFVSTNKSRSNTPTQTGRSPCLRMCLDFAREAQDAYWVQVCKDPVFKHACYDAQAD